MRDLFYFDLLKQGFWIAKRGMINLCIPTTEADCDALVQAVEQFVKERTGLGLSAGELR
ncbi:hypothetical protein D3C71_1991750 [compost metagenome]